MCKIEGTELDHCESVLSGGGSEGKEELEQL